MLSKIINVTVICPDHYQLIIFIYFYCYRLHICFLLYYLNAVIFRFSFVETFFLKTSINNGILYTNWQKWRKKKTKWRFPSLVCNVDHLPPCQCCTICSERQWPGVCCPQIWQTSPWTYIIKSKQNICLEMTNNKSCKVFEWLY